MVGHSGEFHHTTPLDEARETVLAACDPHGRVDHRPVAAADGCVLATSIAARRDVPHYDRAAMDGYAVRAADTFDAGERSPVVLDPTDGSVEPGTARPVNTGEALPEGADAVVMVEQTVEESGDVTVYDAVAEGENVGRAGEDVADGTPLYDAGDRLTPPDLAMVRAVGVDEVPVVDPPRVAVVPTGDELTPPGATPAPGETVETNGLLVSSLAERWGATADYGAVVPDDRDALAGVVTDRDDVDLVVTTGGTSVGERDLLPEVVADRGEVLVHGVALKPGHPVGFGVVGGTPVLLLPGYPVSTLVTAVQFLRPALSALAGTETPPLPTVRGRLTGKLRSAPGERTFARVRLVDAAETAPAEPAEVAVEPVRVGGAGVLSSVTGADGWVEIPDSREGIPAGEAVVVQQWDAPR